MKRHFVLDPDWRHSLVSSCFVFGKILRGSKNAAFRICPCCGRVVYFAMGRRFICPNETDAEIMVGNRVIVSESVLTEKRKRWIAGEKGLTATGIKTTRTPLDGFASDLPWYADENPSVFRPYLAEEFIKAVSVDNPRDRRLDLAVAHSEMAASGNGIDAVLPLVEGKLTSVLRRRLDKFLSLDEKEKSVLPLYEERGFSVGLPVAGHR